MSDHVVNGNSSLVILEYMPSIHVLSKPLLFNNQLNLIKVLTFCYSSSSDADNWTIKVSNLYCSRGVWDYTCMVNCTTTDWVDSKSWDSIFQTFKTFHFMWSHSDVPFQVLHFDYKHFQGNISRAVNTSRSLEFRVKDWGPAPRWVAFVDFFLASRAKHAVVSGAHRRVGTTYAQLIAALAAANHLGILLLMIPQSNIFIWATLLNKLFCNLMVISLCRRKL
jgi:hypothetical protein